MKHESFSLIKLKSDIYIHILSERKHTESEKFHEEWFNLLKLAKKSFQYSLTKNITMVF